MKEVKTSYIKSLLANRVSHLNTLVIFLCATIITLTQISCSGVQFSQWHLPYMMEVSQGKYITKEQVSALKVGMTKEQVLLTLGGEPLTQPMFDSKRWDFLYQDYKNNKLNKSYQLTLIFDNNNLVNKITTEGAFFNK